VHALITGSSGFIGRNLVRYFVSQGWLVTGWDIVRPPDEFKEQPYDVTFMHQYVNVAALNESDSMQYDLVLHCAANIGGRMGIEYKGLHVAQNLGIDASFFRWAVATRQPHVVYYSSSAAYPVHLQTKESWTHLAEEMLNTTEAGHLESMPDAIYGWAKVSGEVLARYTRTTGMRVDIIRPFSGYGPDQDMDYPVPAICKRAAERKHPFEVWGTGTQIRDFIHVLDVVHGTHIITQAKPLDSVNLCTGRGMSILDIARIAINAAGYLSPTWIETATHRPVGVHGRVGDPQRMRTVFTPRIQVEDGISDIVHGYQKSS
jgi:nucleoside-diphosphate-sugar epimerase